MKNASKQDLGHLGVPEPLRDMLDIPRVLGIADLARPLVPIRSSLIRYRLLVPWNRDFAHNSLLIRRSAAAEILAVLPGTTPISATPEQRIANELMHYRLTGRREATARR